jgi:hypothetical protein
MDARMRSLITGLVAGSVGLALPIRAQSSSATSDSTPHFSLFGGTSGTESRGPENGLNVGASGDFRWKPIPVPLRLSLSFSQRYDSYPYGARKGGSASLELVMHPIPKKFGIQPYFLGGFGVGTRVGYDAWASVPTFPYGNELFTQPLHIVRPRQTWAFASAGIGLDVGRAFIQLRATNPIASDGPIVLPLTVGFRFWD